MGCLIEFQRRNKLNGHWESIELSKIITPCDEITIGGTFRILVNGKQVHMEERVNANA